MVLGEQDVPALFGEELRYLEEVRFHIESRTGGLARADAAQCLRACSAWEEEALLHEERSAFLRALQGMGLPATVRQAMLSVSPPPSMMLGDEINALRTWFAEVGAEGATAAHLGTERMSVARQ